MAAIQTIEQISNTLVTIVADANYFQRSEVSNSDLTWLRKTWMNEKDRIDLEKAYKFGSLIDAMITEPHRVNYFKFTVDDVQYTEQDFKIAQLMKKSFNNDDLCKMMLQQANTQAIMRRKMAIIHEGVKFFLEVRCKWDLWMQVAGWGGDIKSTTAETQKQFVEACRFFDYDRQRAWYMDIAGSKQDLLIGISKKNYKIFKLPITRGDDFYNSGKRKYQDLAYKWWYLFN